MPFVMVPVPEEHVFEVMQLIIKFAKQAALEPWEQSDLDEYFLAAVEPVRSLLSVVSRSTLAGREVGTDQVVTAMELKLRDLAGILKQIDQECQAMSRVALFEVRTETTIGPAGRPMTKRTFVMEEATARMVRSAEQTTRELEPHPLDGMGA